MRRVTRVATLYAIAEVLEHPRSFFVGMALDAGLVLETTQLRAGALAVLIVAVGALDHALVDSMSLVEVGRRPNLIVALETRLLTGAIVQRIASRSELGWDQVVVSGTFVSLVTGGAIDGAFDVIAGTKMRGAFVLCVTRQANIDFSPLLSNY